MQSWNNKSGVAAQDSSLVDDGLSTGCSEGCLELDEGVVVEADIGVGVEARAGVGVDL